ncbi:MAG: hypothetical protein IJP68_12735, partial [Selenomonadaceae bacterium]|nr:hypothetical protein [Selenomonadaceae bacterium]
LAIKDFYSVNVNFFVKHRLIISSVVRIVVARIIVTIKIVIVVVMMMRYVTKAVIVVVVKFGLEFAFAIVWRTTVLRTIVPEKPCENRHFNHLKSIF